MKPISVFALLKKNFIMFFRSKFSSILIILIPVLIVLAAGYAFDSSSLTNVYVGVYSNSSSPLSQKIINGFEEGGFSIKDFDSLKSCVDSVKLNEVQICSEFSKEVSTDSSRDSVTFYVDYSRINLANTLVNNAENEVNSESQEAGKFFVQDLIDIVDIAKENLPDSKLKLDSAFSKLSEKLSEERSSVDTLNSSYVDFEKMIGYLESASEKMNASSTKTQITNALTLAKALKKSNQDISLSLQGVFDSENGVLEEASLAIESIKPVIESASSSKVTNAENVVSPVKLEVKSIRKNSKSRDYLIPILISLITLFGSLLLSSTFILKEKKTLAYFRNFMTPTKSATFIFSTYLTCLIILIFQLILVFLGIKFILGISSFLISFELIVILLLASSVFIFIGMFIGYLFRSEESVIFTSMIVAGIFMFFSNVILPIESVSSNLFSFSVFNPLILLDLGLKKIMLFNFTFSSISLELSYLGGFLVVFAILTYLARKITRRML